MNFFSFYIAYIVLVDCYVFLKTHFFHSCFVCFEREVTNSFFQGAILVKFWSFWCQLDRDSNSAQLLVNRSMLLILPCLSHHQTKLELYLPSSPSAIRFNIWDFLKLNAFYQEIYCAWSSGLESYRNKFYLRQNVDNFCCSEELGQCISIHWWLKV